MTVVVTLPELAVMPPSAVALAVLTNLPVRVALTLAEYFFDSPGFRVPTLKFSDLLPSAATTPSGRLSVILTPLMEPEPGLDTTKS